MKKTNLLTPFMLSVALAALADMPPQPDCSAATLRGEYGIQRSGHNGSGTLITAVGIVTFDGKGRFVGHQKVSRNGVFAKEDVEGAYTVNRDCTGTVTDLMGNASKIVIVHRGDGALGLSTTIGDNQSLRYERVSDSAHQEVRCGLDTFRGVYGYTRSGHVSAGELIAVGILYSDGAGNQSTTQTIDRNGVTNDAAFTGTYTVDADCTSPGFDNNGKEFVLAVLVHGGREVLAMSETAGNNVALQAERIDDPPPAVREGQPCREGPQRD